MGYQKSYSFASSCIVGAMPDALAFNQPWRDGGVDGLPAPVPVEILIEFVKDEFRDFLVGMRKCG